MTDAAGPISERHAGQGVAGGVLTAEQVEALRALDARNGSPPRSSEPARRRAVPLHQRLRRHLRHDRAGACFSAPCLFRRAASLGACRRARFAAAAGVLGAGRVSSPASAAWRCPASCCCWSSPSSVFLAIVGSKAAAASVATRHRRLGLRRQSRCRRCVSAAATALHYLALPRADHHRRRRRARWSPAIVAPLRPAGAGDVASQDVPDCSAAVCVLRPRRLRARRCASTSAIRQRLTRRTDSAFWLHVLAAPLIVHPLVIRLRSATSVGASNPASALRPCWRSSSALSLVALVVDRPARMLVADARLCRHRLRHAGRSNAGLDRRRRSPLILLVLGALVILLGAGWQRIRRLHRALLPVALAHRLPPIHNRPCQFKEYPS